MQFNSLPDPIPLEWLQKVGGSQNICTNSALCVKLNDKHSFIATPASREIYWLLFQHRKKFMTMLIDFNWNNIFTNPCVHSFCTFVLWIFVLWILCIHLPNSQVAILHAPIYMNAITNSFGTILNEDPIRNEKYALTNIMQQTFLTKCE